jgi:hypothetical protein
MANNLSEVYEAAYKYALDEIAKYGLPSLVHLYLSLDKGTQIANNLNCDNYLVRIGICLMDLKLGEAFKKNEQNKHVEYSLKAAKEFLERFDILPKQKEILLNTIAAHHKAVPFISIESEICANADCYRFMHPLGVFYYLVTLGKRDMAPLQILEAAESKLDEKLNILSLDYCKKELMDSYHAFKQLFQAAKQELDRF